MCGPREAHVLVAVETVDDQIHQAINLCGAAATLRVSGKCGAVARATPWKLPVCWGRRAARRSRGGEDKAHLGLVGECLTRRLCHGGADHHAAAGRTSTPHLDGSGAGLRKLRFPHGGRQARGAMCRP